VASYLDAKGQQAQVIDMNQKDISWEELPQMLREINPDVVGVSSWATYFIPNFMRVVQIAKAINPKIATVMGGVMATLISERLMGDYPKLDFIVRGDGELTMHELVQALESGVRDLSHIEGLTWRKNGEIVVNPNRPLIKDLDSLPFPNWELVEIDKYGVNTFPPSWGPQVMLTLTRGCPYGCEYCTPTRAAYNTYREHSPERAVEMLKVLYEKYGRRMFWLNDLIFFVNEDWSREFCERVIKEGLKIRLCVDMRVDLVLKRKNLLPLMKEAGVGLVAMGFETPVEEDLEKYNKYAKGFDVRRGSKEAIRLLEKHKINTWGFFMLGELDHTPQKMRHIWEFANEINPDVAIFAYVTPHPGTPYYDRVKDYIITEDYSHYGEYSPVFRYPLMTENQARKLYQEIWVNYYIMPKRLLTKFVFGNSYSRWFYRFMLGNWQNWGWGVRYSWEVLEGWQGFGEEEKELRKWAKDVLGIPRWWRVVQLAAGPLSQLALKIPGIRAKGLEESLEKASEDLRRAKRTRPQQLPNEELVSAGSQAVDAKHQAK
jgi:anaerobic magnesium-protoporphyrin IX monomethyl ester cyclase